MKILLELDWVTEGLLTWNLECVLFFYLESLWKDESGRTVVTGRGEMGWERSGVEQWTMSPCVKQSRTCSFSCCLFVDAIMACLWRRLICVRLQDGMTGISIIHFCTTFCKNLTAQTKRSGKRTAVDIIIWSLFIPLNMEGQAKSLYSFKAYYFHNNYSF